MKNKHRQYSDTELMDICDNCGKTRGEHKGGWGISYNYCWTERPLSKFVKKEVQDEADIEGIGEDVQAQGDEEYL